MKVGLIQDIVYQNHRTGQHPEHPSRLQAIETRLTDSGLSADTASATARPATSDQILEVHDRALFERVKASCQAHLPTVDSADTAISSDSFDVALLAAGAGLTAAERILSGDWVRAFAAVRPPGHHAEHAKAMGFCLFNNVAILARHLQRQPGIRRVAIIDWDVHHGNGTQHTFEEDPDVLFVSLHQWPFYPGTGSEKERGIGAGDGTTLNLNFGPGTDDSHYLRRFEGEVLPVVEDFAPDFVLLSAGFDAHRADPLGGLSLTEDAYRIMTAGVVDLAVRFAQGRIISLLEGGYDLDALASCVEVHLAGLLASG